MKRMKRMNQILLFILGFGLFMFTRRSEVVPTIQIMIVIAPIFILRFSRTQEKRKGILLTLLGFTVSMNIALWALFEMNDMAMTIFGSLIRSTLLAVLYFIPFMIDRLLYDRFNDKGEIGVLIFPIAMTATMFLSSLEGPFDGMVAKTIYQMGSIQFKQLASVFGLWGYIFFYSWLSAVVVKLWEEGFKLRKAKVNIISIVVVFIAVMSFGFIKISSTDGNKNETVKIAAVVLLPENGVPVNMFDIYIDKRTDDVDEVLSEVETMTGKVSENGAKLVTFQENTAMLSYEDVTLFESGLQKIAKKNDIYLSITFGYYGQQEDEKGENIQYLITPEGETVINYSKRYLLGLGDLGETGVFKKGKEILQVHETSFGIVGVVTCRDMDFEKFIKQASDKKVAIMLGPSYDFPASYGPSYDLRAVENGFSFVRATYNGYSYAEDFNGEILADMHSSSTDDGIMYAEVPVKGIRTVYGKVGNLFGKLNVAVLFVFIVLSIIIGKKSKVNV